MAKINVEDMYKGRLEQIAEDLKKEYCKGKRKNKVKIAQLMQEKKRIEKCLGVI